METINYKGMELDEVTTPQIFDPPRRCVLWDDDFLSPIESYVIAIFPESAKLKCNVMNLYLYRYQHCALLPDPPKPRRATNRELARWLATEGEMNNGANITTFFTYGQHNGNDECSSHLKVRKWDDTEWHEPTVDYMGLEEEK